MEEVTLKINRRITIFFANASHSLMLPYGCFREHRFGFIQLVLVGLPEIS
jgi:hypothetical protein